jgi:serine/threonine protein kinase
VSNGWVSLVGRSVDMRQTIAQPSGLHTYDEITAPTLRAPEIILHGPWDEKVDIWAFGCLVGLLFPIISVLPTHWTNLQIFELVTGSALFEHKPYPKYSLDETTAHLWQMLCFTRERITRQQVKASKLGARYFDLAVNPDDVDNPFCLSSLSVTFMSMTYLSNTR